MSLFFGRPRDEEDRAYAGTGGWVDFGHGGVAGATVSEERARRLSYVFAAIRHIADFGGTLPLEAYRKEGEDRKPIPLPPLFRNKLENGTLVPWMTAAFASLAARGNAVGVIRGGVDGFGYPRDIEWMPMSVVSFDVRGWVIAGELTPASQVVHIPWVTVPGQMLALSPLAAYQSTVDAAQNGQDYASKWYAAGGIPPGTFRNREKVIMPEQSEQIRDRLVASIRTGKPLVYGADWEYQAVTIAPEQAVFVDQQKLTAAQIAAVYGIEPQEVGGEAANGLTYNNEEHRQTKRLANMRPYLTRVEHAMNAITPVNTRIKFNGDAIIRADIKTRYEVYERGLRMKVLNRNEVRAREDMSPIPGGDAYDGVDMPAAPLNNNPADGDTPGGDAPRRLHVITEEHA